MRISLLTFACVAVLSASASAGAPAAPGYRVAKKFLLPGDGGWDFLTFDSASNRVYVTHGDQVQALDAGSGELKGSVTGLKGVHGVALAEGKGFISDGKDDSVVVFDASTFKVVKTVKVGKNPDAILYDPASGRVFVFDARSAELTVIDPKSLAVLGTVAVAGQPEFGAMDGKGALYMDLEDKGELLKIDTQKLKVLERWKTKGCDEPSAMAFDPADGRIFLGCSNKIMEALDAADGKTVATLPIGQGVDAITFDAAKGLIFASCGDGTLTVARRDDASHYAVAETVATPRRSKTSALDASTHRLFVPTAEFGPAPEQKPGEHKRAPVLPGTFAVLVLEAAPPQK
jgi:YVTN family beta-propeller protein